MNIPIILTEDYNYILPQDKIAQHPLAKRDESKLVVYKNGTCSTDLYKNIADYLPENSLIIFNNSKVIPARILYVKETSGIIELFCLEPKEGTPYEALQHRGQTVWTCMIGGLKKWKRESSLQWKIDLEEECFVFAKYVGENEHGFEIEFSWSDEKRTFAEVLVSLGQMPIPPYLHRKAEQEDKQRYQTVYASVEGSVAAPTAGLHFTERILDGLAKKNIQQVFTTLHVGAGTFKPVDATFAHEHQMHAEWIQAGRLLINQLASANPIIAVGTTSLRTVESLYWYATVCMRENKLQQRDYVLPQFISYENMDVISKKVAFEFLSNQLNSQDLNEIIFKTELMILPTYTVKVATHLITNFHQPRSTLLMLVNAFTKGQWKQLYEYALSNDCRFLSYGDGCLLEWETA